MINTEDGRAGIRFADPVPGARADHLVMESPLGELVLFGDGRAVSRIELLRHLPGGAGDDSGDDTAGVLKDAADQLREYFAGRRTGFELAVAPDGTAFQRVVWRRLAGIPYGETTTYGRIAHEIGRPAAARAVGAANGANPVPIILPCHRVIGSTGSLVKYGLGGLARKRQLLDLESGGTLL